MFELERLALISFLNAGFLEVISGTPMLESISAEMLYLNMNS